MEKLQIVLHWAQANPVTFVAIAVYVIANLMPRPHPEHLTGWKRTFWAIIDGLCVLTAGKVPGRLKWLLANSPSLGAGASAAAEAGEPDGGGGPAEDEPGEGEELTDEKAEKVEDRS